MRCGLVADTPQRDFVLSGGRRSAVSERHTAHATKSTKRTERPGEVRPVRRWRSPAPQEAATVNGTVARVFSHQMASVPPCGVMSANAIVSWSSDTGVVSTFIGTRTTSFSAV